VEALVMGGLLNWNALRY